MLSDIWSFGVSLVEMALGRFPIPKPSDQEIDEEMKLPPAGSLPPRPKNDNASVEEDKNVPIFAMLVHVVEDVSIMDDQSHVLNLSLLDLGTASIT